MTDEEIMKALECCICSTSRNDCEDLNCPACKEFGCDFMDRSTEDYPDSLIQEIGKSALDLINRQQAEIERLKKILENRGEICKLCEGKYTEKIKRAKTEAIKEFAERFEKEIETSPYMSVPLKYTMLKNARQIKDNLVKEMVGE